MFKVPGTLNGWVPYKCYHFCLILMDVYGSCWKGRCGTSFCPCSLLREVGWGKQITQNKMKMNNKEDTLFKVGVARDVESPLFCAF